MTTYASNTKVSPDKSRAEIERTLMRYGASGFFYGWNEDKAIVGFSMAKRQIKFLLPVPPESDFWQTETGRTRSAGAIAEAHAKAVRQRWRALALVIKAKLEAVESGIVTFDEEFMAHIVLPDGQTIGQAMLPQIESAYDSGRMPPLLPHYGE